MILRPAAPLDASSIAALWNAMIRDTLHTFTTIEKTPEEIAQLVAARSGAFWVAEDDKLLGFVTYGPFRAGPGYDGAVEHGVILRADARGRGVGRALMQHAMKNATKQGKHVMVAGISGANPGAIAFHKALGFQQTGHMPEVGQKHGQRLDLILMQKTLHLS